MKGKELFLADVPHSEEWREVPADWKCIGQRDAQNRRGQAMKWISFMTPHGPQDIPDFALRREKGKNFEILNRVFNDLMKEAEGGASP